jgi:hypothetical protein
MCFSSTFAYVVVGGVAGGVTGGAGVGVGVLGVVATAVSNYFENHSKLPVSVNLLTSRCCAAIDAIAGRAHPPYHAWRARHTRLAVSSPKLSLQEI